MRSLVGRLAPAVRVRVSIEGHAEPMPSAAEAPRLWKLITRAEGEAMQGHACYISATRVKTPQVTTLVMGWHATC